MTEEEVNAILQEIEVVEFISPTYDAYSDMVFHLYTRSNPTESQVIQIDNVESLRASHFKAEHPTVFLVLGWLNDYKMYFVQDGKDEYLKKGDYNVIGVDWSKAVQTLDFILSRTRVFPTGVVLGKFIEFLEANGVNINKVIVAGYSLGGHVSANAGKHLNGRLPVIFALDPSGTLFFPSDLDRLTPSDAIYVEVIHTNYLTNGYPTPIGDVDFYPNGGADQPGCELDPPCSHSRAPIYFVESINGNAKFIGKRCRSFDAMLLNSCFGPTKVMGGEPYTPGRGIYYLDVSSEAPYAKN